MSCSITIFLLLLSKIYLSASQDQDFNYPQQVPLCAAVGNSQAQGRLLVSFVGPAL